MSMPTVEVTIGGVPIALRTHDEHFAGMLRERYKGFVEAGHGNRCEFEIDTVAPQLITDADDVNVSRNGEEWIIRRGDFLATFHRRRRSGKVRQSANPYSIDTVLRIVHSLILAEEGGFLLHAGSVIRDGKAFLFSGVSGAGKTTITRLAPEDTTLLTDEISYIRKIDGRYHAFGTPFAGELAKSGDNVSAPVEALYLLAKGPENKIEPIPVPAATRRIMRNVLFFAEDPMLVNQLFETVLGFVQAVRVEQLTFFPDCRVWELIR